MEKYGEKIRENYRDLLEGLIINQFNKIDNFEYFFNMILEIDDDFHGLKENRYQMQLSDKNKKRNEVNLVGKSKDCNFQDNSFSKTG